MTADSTRGRAAMGSDLRCKREEPDNCDMESVKLGRLECGGKKVLRMWPSFAWPRETALIQKDRLKRFLEEILLKPALDSEKLPSFWLEREFLFSLRTPVTLDDLWLASYGTE